MGIIEHETGNPDLKRLLKEFDDSTEVRGEGLNLSCDIYSDSICYTIDYTTNISYAGPTIVCEPVNGKEVTMTVRDLWNDIRLLPARSNELLKDSNPEEYRERLLQVAADQALNRGFRPAPVGTADIPARSRDRPAVS